MAKRKKVLSQCSCLHQCAPFVCFIVFSSVAPTRHTHTHRTHRVPFPIDKPCFYSSCSLFSSSFLYVLLLGKLLLFEFITRNISIMLKCSESVHLNGIRKVEHSVYLMKKNMKSILALFVSLNFLSFHS